MIAHTLVFKDSEPMYSRMADVLVESMRRHSPSVPTVIHSIEPDERDLSLYNSRRKPTYIQNTRKTRYFAQLVNNSTNGAVLLLLDCDMLCIRDAAELHLDDDGQWDIALTYRNKSPNLYLFNTGVVAIRVSEFMKDWCCRWAAKAEELLLNESEHAKLRKKYGGINQSSLGALLESYDEIRVRKLSTQQWNALPSNYPTCLDTTHFIHLMGTLRGLLFRPRIHGNGPQHTIARLWQEYSQQQIKHASTS